MSNYYSDGIAEIPLLADGDLTEHQWEFVAPASTVGYAASSNSGCNPVPLGILTNNPSAGQEATVKALGFTKAKARCNGCDLDHGAYCFGASDAFLEPISSLTGTQIALARWFGPKVVTTDASVIGCIQWLGGGGAGCATNGS